MAACRILRLVALAAVAAAAVALAACRTVVGAPREGSPGSDHPNMATSTVGGGVSGGSRRYEYNPWLAAVRPYLPSARLAAAAARQEEDNDSDSEDGGSGQAAPAGAASSVPSSPPGLTCQTWEEVRSDVAEAAASLRADDEAPPGAAEAFTNAVLTAYPSFVVDVVGDRSCVQTGAFGDFLIDTLVSVLDDSDDDEDEQH
ncbi:hypothetical protein MMPV_008326 [Pyropia vietnamensis]